MKEEKRIYVVLPATVEVPAPMKFVVQPSGRQIAQACHVVSKLRHEMNADPKIIFHPLTTIILAARDSKEMMHAYIALNRRKLKTVIFSDENEAAYGRFQPITALATLASPRKVAGILDYLPLWGS